jgi:hypothetical protein
MQNAASGRLSKLDAAAGALISGYKRGNRVDGKARSLNRERDHPLPLFPLNRYIAAIFTSLCLICLVGVHHALNRFSSLVAPNIVEQYVSSCFWLGHTCHMWRYENSRMLPERVVFG